MNGSNTAGTFSYARKLLNAGFSGIRSGRPAAFHERPVSNILSDAAATLVPLAAAAASVALFHSFATNRGRSANIWTYGAVGTAIGLIAGVGWQSRKVAASLAHSAVTEVNKTRDQHWLEQHPIDYA
jgi:hypothetical protein